MSHLEAPRIVIAGRFMSDVSTINNIDQNFDIDQKPTQLLWNPRGGATFDFYDCGVSGASRSGGAAAATDPVLTLAVSGAADRPSAKMVDLDPDWQGSSEIWGLTVRLFDPATKELALQGTFGVTQFRDLFMRQLAQALAGQFPNGQPSGGRFVSTLTDVVWGAAADRSDLLKELRNTTEGNELSIVLNTFGYYYNEVEGRHATGALTACIGPRRKSEPRTFVGARRLPALALTIPGVVRPVVLIGPSDATIDAGNRATIDLGHALLISDTEGTITDIKTIGTALADMTALEFGLLPTEATKSGDRLADGSATIFGAIDYLKSDWPKQTGGVASFAIDAAVAAQAKSKPLALLARMQDGSHLVLNRETRDGLYVRADNFLHRLDPGDPADTTFFAFSRGLPADSQTIHLVASPAGNNTPPQAFPFPNKIMTDGTGRATLHVTSSNPGEARPDIDGQIYAVGYSPRLNAAGQLDLAGTGLNPNFDVVVAHVRSAFPVPDRPEWFKHIQPIMAQFAQLYPIMSRHLFDLADYDAMAKHRKMLLLAFGRSIEDPNYMPVTRDLSENKRKTIVRWLQNETGNPAEPLVKGTPVSPVADMARPARRRSPMAAQALTFGETDIKTAMTLLFAKETSAVLPADSQSGH